MAVVKLSKTVGLLGSIDEWCWDETEKFVPNPMAKEKDPFNTMGTPVGKPKEKYRDKPHISHDNLQKTILELVDTVNAIIDDLAVITAAYTAADITLTTNLASEAATREGADTVITTDYGVADTAITTAFGVADATVTAAFGEADVHSHTAAETPYMPEATVMHTHDISRKGGPIRSIKRGGPSRTRPVLKNTR
jgi:hypothetical protein